MVTNISRQNPFFLVGYEYFTSKPLLSWRLRTFHVKNPDPTEGARLQNTSITLIFPYLILTYKKENPTTIPSISFGTSSTVKTPPFQLNWGEVTTGTSVFPCETHYTWKTSIFLTMRLYTRKELRNSLHKQLQQFARNYKMITHNPVAYMKIIITWTWHSRICYLKR